MKKILFILIVSLLLITACSEQKAPENKEYCNKAQRSVEYCYTLYEPVCGYAENNEKIETYSNICNACKNPEVVYFTRSEC